MRLTRQAWQVLLPLLLLVVGAPALAETEAERAFARLRGLAGEWETRLPDGRPLVVSYRSYSADSVLLEVFGSGRPTLTAFHLDRTRLMATHYCAQGNQPRLALRRAALDGALVFDFLDATNLSKDASHLRRLALELLDSQHFVRIETYRTGRDSATTRYAFTRRAPATLPTP